jgi:hypothetical protein
MTARDLIEPEALVAIERDDAARYPTEREVEQSKAISLKRLADAAERIANVLETAKAKRKRRRHGGRSSAFKGRTIAVSLGPRRRSKHIGESRSTLTRPKTIRLSTTRRPKA